MADPGCLWVLKSSQTAITSQCQVLSLSILLELCKSSPKTILLSKDASWEGSVSRAPLCIPPGGWRCSLCGTAVPAGQWQHTLAEAPGTHMHHVRVQVTAGGQPKMSLWPPDLAGRGMVLTDSFFPGAWRNWQLPQRSCPSNREEERGKEGQ